MAKYNVNDIVVTDKQTCRITHVMPLCNGALYQYDAIGADGTHYYSLTEKMLAKRDIADGGIYRII